MRSKLGLFLSNCYLDSLQSLGKDKNLWFINTSNEMVLSNDTKYLVTSTDTDVVIFDFQQKKQINKISGFK